VLKQPGERRITAKVAAADRSKLSTFETIGGTIESQAVESTGANRSELVLNVRLC
jgi:hypothetical protein